MTPARAEWVFQLAKVFAVFSGLGLFVRLTELFRWPDWVLFTVFAGSVWVMYGAYMESLPTIGARDGDDDAA